MFVSLKTLLHTLLLLWRQALPRELAAPHAVHQLQHVLLFLGRKTREISELLSQPPLLCRRQGTKVRVVLQRPLLLAGRQILVLPQPIPGMALRWARHCLVVRCGISGRMRRSLRSSHRWMVGVSLGQAR